MLALDSTSESGSNDPVNLSMIDCGIKSLKNIPLKLNTVSINLHSNFIQRIENLHFLQSLVHLDLSSNQIKRIDGLQGLVSLQSLNLSCNSIVSIENLDGLKALKSINLSYNQIQYINGLADLWGTDYSLECLLLNANFLSSIEELTYYLSGLVNLRHVNLKANKFLQGLDYRIAVYGCSKSIVSIDGRDKANRTVRFPVGTSSQSNQFSEFMDLSKSMEDMCKFGVNYPKLDRVASNADILTKLKKPTHQKAGAIKKTITTNRPKSHSPSNNNSNNNTTYLSKEINSILQTTSNSLDLASIEDKIHNLLALRNRFKSTHKSSSSMSNSSSSEDEKEATQISQNRSQTNNLTRVKSILKDSNTTYTVESNSDSKLAENTLANSQREKDKSKKEFIGLIQTQLDAYKTSTEQNIQLIADLRGQLDKLGEEKRKALADRDDKLKALTEANGQLNGQINEFKLKNECLETKVTSLSQVVAEKQQNPVLTADQIEQQLKHKLKKSFHSELEKSRQQHQKQMAECQEQVRQGSEALRALEDEFRTALVIEAKRYSDLLAKYELSGKELAHVKGSFAQLEQSEARNKSLIQELNALIKEQKTRLVALAKRRQETNEDVQVRSEKLAEAVADCAKLRVQVEDLKREKVKVEAQLKMVACKYKEIEQEKFTWTQRLNDQKNLLAQEINRLQAECQASNAELETVKRCAARDADDVRIKAKIVEDQTETIRKLKSGILERDLQLKEHRGESLKTQKSLEKQLNEEMDHANELDLKLEKVTARKEDLKAECEELRCSLNETKQAYEELTNKWKQKSQLISDLDAKVRHMKQNYELKEAELVGEADKLRTEASDLTERLRKVDDSFRRQYDVEKREHLKLLEKTKAEYELKLKAQYDKVDAIEHEMRQILLESDNKTKLYEQKITQVKQAFKNF